MDKLYILVLVLSTGAIAWLTDRKSCASVGASQEVSYHNKQAYLFFICIIMYFIISLRDFSVGSDTWGYVKSFQYMDISQGIVYQERDQAFAILNYLLRHVTDNGHIYLFLVSWPLPLSFYLLLKDEKCSCLFVYMSFIILLLLEIFAFSMAGIRQTIAIFFTVVAYKCLEKKRIIWFLLAAAVGATFHLSASLFFVVILLGRKKFGLIHVAILAIVLYLVQFNPDLILQIIGDSELGKSYWVYGTVYKSDASYTMLMIQCAMLCMLLIDRRILEEDISNRALLNNAFVGVVASVCSPIIAEFFRISFYFSIYLCLLIPRVIFRMKDSNRKMCSTAIWACALLYMIIFNNPLGSYKFFW